MCSAHLILFKPLFGWYRIRGVWNLLKLQ
jgi:hypothetical protein